MKDVLMQMLNEINAGLKTALTRVNELVAENKALKEALAPLPEQEPVAWAIYYKGGGSKSLHWPEQHSPNGDANMFDDIALYTTPPKRPWVGLTYEDMVKLQKDLYDAKGESVLPTTFAMAVEAKLKEKNT